MPKTPTPQQALDALFYEEKLDQDFGTGKARAQLIREFAQEDSQLFALLEALCEKTSRSDLRAINTLMFNVGVRVGELLRLREAK